LILFYNITYMETNNYSPLRYPGGKAKLANTFKELIVENELDNVTYIEPFAGGANVALSLLINEYVSNILINDIDPALYSFWTSILKYTDKFIKKIKNCNISLSERERQRFVIFNQKQYSLTEIGFAFFYLNRTNYSGIIKGGPIGGKQQKGSYTLDARFNKEELIKKIQTIAEYESRITVTNVDSINLINRVKNIDSSIVYFDPPYYKQGKSLYTNFYVHKDHANLAKKIKSLTTPWILTYDNVPEIKALYKNCRTNEFLIQYSANQHTFGKEVMFFNNIVKTNFLETTQCLF